MKIAYVPGHSQIYHEYLNVLVYLHDNVVKFIEICKL